MSHSLLRFALYSITTIILVFFNTNSVLAIQSCTINSQTPNEPCATGYYCSSYTVSATTTNVGCLLLSDQTKNPVLWSGPGTSGKVNCSTNLQPGTPSTTDNPFHPDWFCPAGSTCQSVEEGALTACVPTVDLKHPNVNSECDPDKQQDSAYACPTNSFCNGPATEGTSLGGYICLPSRTCTPDKDMEAQSKYYCEAYTDVCDDSAFICSGTGQDGTCCPGNICYTPPQTPSGHCVSPDLLPTATPTPADLSPCPSQKGECKSIDTALGTIDVNDPGAFIKTAFGILLSISGGIAVLLIVFSGYRIMMAQGDPEKLKGAREMLTSAIIGLLFMIFSVTILQILGVDIFHIPGFTGG